MGLLSLENSRRRRWANRVGPLATNGEASNNFKFTSYDGDDEVSMDGCSCSSFPKTHGKFPRLMIKIKANNLPLPGMVGQAWKGTEVRLKARANFSFLFDQRGVHANANRFVPQKSKPHQGKVQKQVQRQGKAKERSVLLEPGQETQCKGLENRT